jgi:hypothetical protein
MSVNRKKAPRREVLEVERVGEWGEVTYRHRLSCGHTDVRKRPAPATHVACVMCHYEVTRPAVTKAVSLPEYDFDPYSDSFATAESDAAMIRAGLAARFGVSNDAVDTVVSASGELSYVVVFLDAATARRLA